MDLVQASRSPSALQCVKALAQSLFEAAPPAKHPLFVALADQVLAPDQARAIALDIHHVVENFPRFLSAVMTSMEDFEQRMPLVQNFYAEHGGLNPKKVHVVTYRHFLHALHISEDAIVTHEPSIGAVVYVRAVLSLCMRADPSEALAALAVIEEVVARVSPIVGRWGQKQGARGAHAENHFGVHETLDLSHADELYELAADFWNRRPDSVRRGLKLGMYYQRRLYSDLTDQHLGGA